MLYKLVHIIFKLVTPKIRSQICHLVLLLKGTYFVSILHYESSEQTMHASTFAHD